MKFSSKFFSKIFSSILFCIFSLFLFLTFSSKVSANVLTNLSVSVTSSGDIPTVTISCTTGHAYTLTFTNNTGTYLIGGIQRLYCSSGTITFNSLNLNTFLTARYAPDNWWMWAHTPVYYVIKDTTIQSECNEKYCSLYNLPSAPNFYDQFANDALNTDFETVDAGPVFDTVDHITWTNTLNGDGSGNYVPPPPPPTHSSILFLPGIEASRLYRGGRPDEGGGEKSLWEPLNNQNAKDLFLDENGKEPSPLLPEYSVYTRDVIDEAYIPQAGTNIYKSFLAELEKMKNTDKSIADYSAIPYDWRLSINDILIMGNKTGSGNSAKISYTDGVPATYIISELRRLVAGSQNGKVTIVAHSNGGLVAKGLLKMLADAHDPLLDKVDKLVLVAVPQLGTPSSILALLHGYKQGIPDDRFSFFLSEYISREFAHNMTSAYNLLPSEKYFGYVDTPVVTFGSEKIHSTNSLHNFLTDTYGRVDSGDKDTDTPTSLRDGFLTNSESLHSWLDVWTPPVNMEVVEVAGWGVPDTVSGVKYTMSHGKIQPRPTWTIDGDGTVVTPSALWTNGNASTTRYWVDLDAYNIFLVRHENHKSLLEVPQLITYIKNIIITGQSTTTLPTYISTTTPTTFSTIPRLVYSLHSPLTLDIYDDFGNHTGISTTTGKLEEQIPGTYFIQFGEEKYIFTNTGSGLHIAMSGYATSTFTFSVEQLQGDNTISSVTFQDIPTTPTTRVSIGVTSDISTISSLLVDSDSNGTADITLAPVIGGTVTYTAPSPVSTSTPVSNSSGSSAPAPVGNGMPVSSGLGPISAPVIALVSTSTSLSTTTPEIILPSATTSASIVKQKIKDKTAQIENKSKIIEKENNKNQTASVISSIKISTPKPTFLGNFWKKMILYIKQIL